MNSEYPDYEFRKELFNTLVLMGAPDEIAHLAKKSLDAEITAADVKLLSGYNYKLFGDAKLGIKGLKERLERIDTVKVSNV